MAWSAGSRWVGVGPSGGGGGTPGPPGPQGPQGLVTPWVLAPGGGVNAGTTWETLSALVAAADLVQADGLVDIWLDATANSDVYTATTDDGLTNIQRIRLTGASGHGFIRPTFAVPTGVSFECFGEINGVEVLGTGGRLVIPSGGRLLGDVSSFKSSPGQQAVLQQVTGFGAAFLKGCEIGESASSDDSVLVASGATLVGKWIASSVRENAISNSAGAGTFDCELFSCDAVNTQTLLVGSAFNAKPSPISTTHPQAFPLPIGHVRGGRATSISVLTFNVTPFEARDQNNEINIISTGSIAMNLATQGAGGKDYAGATLSSTAPHCVYAIWGPGVAVSAIASLSWVSPTLPVGYTHYVCIEIVIPFSATTLHAQETVGSDARVQKIFPLITLGTITAAAQTAFVLTAFVPNISRVNAVEVSLTPNGGNSTFYTMRNFSGGPNFAVTSTGSYAIMRATIPLISTTIYGFCSAGAVAGTMYLQGLHFTRGAQ